jgi:GNAT superfamily N-acetyltransferase
MAALAAPPAPSPIVTPGIRIRPLEPPDADLVEAVHAGLSSDSRYTRYHGPKPRLSAAERAYLAGTDGRDHVALVAFDGAGAPLGIARFIRDRADRGSAEIAAEVVDAWQRQGIGSTMLARLARRAVAGGVARFTATVLAQTGFARALRRHGWRVIEGDGLTVALEIETWRLAARPPQLRPGDRL